MKKCLFNRNSFIYLVEKCVNGYFVLSPLGAQRGVPKNIDNFVFMFLNMTLESIKSSKVVLYQKLIKLR